MSAVLVDGKVLAAGKRGTAYLLDPAHLGGVGGQLSQLSVCKPFGGAAVSGSVAYLPCTDGLRAVSVSGNWRLVFAFDDEHAVLVDYVDYH